MSRIWSRGAVTEILGDEMPRARYAIIPGADHMSPLSHPEFIATAIREHIGG
jgi:pimeloyl-ACP methyl ester carboxylesterase